MLVCNPVVGADAHIGPRSERLRFPVGSGEFVDVYRWVDVGIDPYGCVRIVTLTIIYIRITIKSKRK